MFTIDYGYGILGALGIAPLIGAGVIVAIFLFAACKQAHDEVVEESMIAATTTCRSPDPLARAQHPRERPHGGLLPFTGRPDCAADGKEIGPRLDQRQRIVGRDPADRNTWQFE